MTMWEQVNPSVRHYGRMVQRHPALWQFVDTFVKEHNIDSVIDVGCGLMPPARSMVKHWTGVDLHPCSDAVHVNFCHVDVSRLTRAELLLACGVVEHVDGFDGFVDFMTNVKRYDAPYTIVSFFNGLSRRRSLIGFDVKRGFHKNYYAKSSVMKLLDELKLNYKLTHLSAGDDVIIITKTQESSGYE